MRSQDELNAQRVRSGLARYERRVHPLAGIADPAYRETLIRQFVESLRRIRYVTLMTQRDASTSRADPSGELFDPERAAVFYYRQGNLDEAFWLLFLSVHFGKPRRGGWQLVRDVYGRLGGGGRWNWAETSAHPPAFRQWLAANLAILKGGDGILRKFGNHRKYESLHPYSDRGTGAVIESYVNWVTRRGGHQGIIQEAVEEADGNPRSMFDYLYHSMDVMSFGRTAKFDYLTMVGKLGLAPIEPGSTYMDGATGPFRGGEATIWAASSSQCNALRS